MGVAHSPFSAEVQIDGVFRPTNISKIIIPNRNKLLPPPPPPLIGKEVLVSQELQVLTLIKFSHA